ncbi:MAG: hypothetical protein HYX72_02945 [Acidobacteria bacterium]|nr:hypothetical protein [Acidobacteriota bacterium]
MDRQLLSYAVELTKAAITAQGEGTLLVEDKNQNVSKFLDAMVKKLKELDRG